MQLKGVRSDIYVHLTQQFLTEIARPKSSAVSVGGACYEKATLLIQLYSKPAQMFALGESCKCQDLNSAHFVFLLPLGFLDLPALKG